MKKLVSVVVLNWNGKENLKICLDSLKKVYYKPIEVIVVDNYSSDGSQELVAKYYSWVKLIRNKQNAGYAKGNNIGIRKSKGDYIFILNNDTELSKNFLQPLVSDMEKDETVGCVQPKLLYATDHAMLNAVGSFLTSTGFLYHYGYRKDARLAQYNKYCRIYSAKGAAMLLRKKALEKVGLFDEDFFIFFEETDLCHRLWLAGYQVIYEPKSVIFHFEAVDTSKQMKNFTRTYLSFRNRICSYLKNLELKNVFALLLVLLSAYLVLFLFYVFTVRIDQAAAIIMSMAWNIRQLPKTLKKRTFIQQKLRKISDEKLFPIIKKDPKLAYYYYAFIRDLKHYIYENPI